MKTFLDYCAASLFFMVAFATFVSAQVTFNEHTLAENYDARSVFAIDMDDDGDIDVLGSSRTTGNVYWWENDGEQHFTRHIVTDDALCAMDVFAVDLDSDNDIDVVCGLYVDTKINWYENDGNFTFTEHTIANWRANYIHVIDINGDGIVDIAASACEQHRFGWFENDGSGDFTEHVVKEYWSHANCVHVADVDLDGDVDFTCSASFLTEAADGEIAWFENDGHQNFIMHTIVEEYGYPSSAHASDVDLDGDIDVLATACVLDQILWLENDGIQNFTPHIIGTDFQRPRKGTTADLDKDGDIDIVGVALDSDEISWWENDGTQQFSKHPLSTDFRGAIDVFVEDVDHDGDLDILGGATDGNKISWWENNLYGAQFQPDITSGHAPLTVDFTNLSHTDPPLTTWMWDFDTDGTVDSEEQNPEWIYTEPGIYSVSLEVSNGSVTYTRIHNNAIHVFDGESALQFNGENSFVSCPAAASLNLTGPLTIEAWIYPESWGEFTAIGWGRIIDKKNISLYLIKRFPPLNVHSLTVSFSHSNDIISHSSTPDSSIVLNQWHHVAVTYDGDNTVRMYIDGIEQTVTYTTQPSGAIRGNAEENLYIGNDGNTENTFEGIIDEIRIWGVVRSGGEIADNMDVCLSGDEPGLVGSWRMNEAYGGTIFDQSAHGHDGTVTDAVWIQGVHLNPAIVDYDEDGVVNAEDNCPYVYNPEQEDTDGDGVGDVCDNCPNDSNPNQSDADNDSTGDLCDTCTDTDGDGYGDPGYPGNTCPEDNCPETYNPDQAPVEWGDVNCKDAINILDVLSVVNHILGTSPLSGGSLERADCNDDGNVNILDALSIVNIVLGIIPECPGNGYRPEVTPEVMDFCQSLKSHLASEKFDRFMALVRSVRMPVEYHLYQNYPNPFNPETEIRFSLPEDSKVTVTVYNIVGQTVEVLVASELDAGYHVVTWNASGMASGVYLYRLRAGNFTDTKKMAFIK
jgi:PKD repeat protein